VATPGPISGTPRGPSNPESVTDFTAIARFNLMTKVGKAVGDAFYYANPNAEPVTQGSASDTEVGKGLWKYRDYQNKTYNGVISGLRFQVGHKRAPSVRNETLHSGATSPPARSRGLH